MTACSSPAPQPETVFVREAARDFSGHWEVDFSASDSTNNQILTSYRQWQRSAEQRARAASRNRGPTLFAGGNNSASGLIALADMAEIITAPQLLEIIQSDAEVRVRRENSFALVCDFSKTPPVVMTTPFGTESCTWHGREIKFRIDLPEGLLVEHQLLLSEDRNTLALTTAMQSSKVREPLRIRKVFNRYDPNSQGFRCTETLSRGRVCTTEPAQSTTSK